MGVTLYINKKNNQHNKKTTFKMVDVMLVMFSRKYYSRFHKHAKSTSDSYIIFCLLRLSHCHICLTFNYSIKLLHYITAHLSACQIFEDHHD
jgi:hypothetical protein